MSKLPGTAAAWIARHRGGLILLLALSPVFLLAATWLVNALIYADSDFFSFWLAGRMNWTQQSPYSAEQWIAGHSQNGAQWVSDATFLYPLPLAVLLAPLGLLPLKAAYILWVTLSQVAVVVSILLLAGLERGRPRAPLVFPLLLGAFVLRPTLVTLRNGQLGAFLLLAACLAIYLWSRGAWFQGALALACLLLKPTLGGPVIALALVWLLARRQSNAIAGLAACALAFFLLGALRDPGWAGQFLAFGGQKLNSTFGYSPTLWGLSSLACGANAACTWAAGGLTSLACLVGTAAVLLARKGLSPWSALGLILATALLATPYVWGYDQVLLLAPIAWITATLYRRGEAYLLTAVIPLSFAILSLGLLYLATRFNKDAWSALLPLACAALLLACVFRPSHPQPAR
ncbi:MAG: DUF2029 domain-containing protein [Chloroflexi bacterium]|nr:DUF2029 domain-containing protein [Chloroflexota bacterium]